MDNNLDNIKKQLESFYNIGNNIDKPLEKESVEQRCARLITVLIKIEKELVKVENTIEKVWEEAYKNNNEDIKQKALKHLNTVKTLQIKIAKARLNLNYTFI